ncbi:hypothetical protein H0H93_007606, partial [Arthromyces matolae]
MSSLAMGAKYGPAKMAKVGMVKVGNDLAFDHQDNSRNLRSSLRTGLAYVLETCEGKMRTDGCVAVVPFAFDRDLKENIKKIGAGDTDIGRMPEDENFATAAKDCGAIIVGGSTALDDRLARSFYGDWVTLWAPAEAVKGLLTGDIAKTSKWSSDGLIRTGHIGTKFATPMIAGVVACYISAFGNMSAADMTKQLIEHSFKKTWSKTRAHDEYTLHIAQIPEAKPDSGCTVKPDSGYTVVKPDSGCTAVPQAVGSNLAEYKNYMSEVWAIVSPSSGYSNAVIGSVNTLLRRVYGDDVLSHHNFSTVLSSLTFAGAVVGMLSFGYISDKFGRKFGMMSATGIIFIFSGLSAASSSAHGSVDGMLAMLCAMRFLVGIGIGAEYPCGSVSAAEQTEQPIINKRSQHRWLGLATIFMIDFGFVIASFVPLVLFWIFGENHLRAVWRLSLGLGMVPAGLVFLWRLNMDEPEPYKKNSMKRIRIPYWLVIKRYWVQLSAISFTWFLYDFIVSVSLRTPSSARNMTHLPFQLSSGSNSLSVVFGWNVVINLFYIPGSVIGSFAADYLGPKWTMILGLVLQAVIGFFMSGFYE